ncbi:hypothetical protein ACQYWY_06260 [Comamonas sediminis]|uniref:hypothetical protein n=1 Tax=Comamonas sediminis TaxID=1783360 RepID=UPI003D2A6710
MAEISPASCLNILNNQYSYKNALCIKTIRLTYDYPQNETNRLAVDAEIPIQNQVLAEIYSACNITLIATVFIYYTAEVQGGICWYKTHIRLPRPYNAVYKSKAKATRSAQHIQQ